MEIIPAQQRCVCKDCLERELPRLMTAYLVYPDGHHCDACRKFVKVLCVVKGVDEP